RDRDRALGYRLAERRAQRSEKLRVGVAIELVELLDVDVDAVDAEILRQERELDDGPLPRRLEIALRRAREDRRGRARARARGATAPARSRHTPEQDPVLALAEAREDQLDPRPAALGIPDELPAEVARDLAVALL